MKGLLKLERISLLKSKIFLASGSAVALGLLHSGCSSTMAKIIPIGEPVTAVRCQNLDARKLGFEDGRVGNRSGERFEFWAKDCAAFSVRLSRELYKAGYNDGLKIYCSCETGFTAGAQGEFTALKAQFLMCSKAEHANFVRGVELGKAHLGKAEVAAAMCGANL